MITKALFIDVDGPMIPVRAYYLPKQTRIASVFDPCAVAMVKKLLDESGAKIVISSSWGAQGLQTCADLFDKNDISANLYFHSDWVTPRSFSSTRHHEILEWLRDHPEITHYAAIDDESLPYDLLPNAVKCDAYEGFSYRNYLECKLMLDIALSENEASQIAAMLNWLKRSEVWRTFRKGEPGQWKAHEAVRMMFVDKDNEDE